MIYDDLCAWPLVQRLWQVLIENRNARQWWIWELAMAFWVLVLCFLGHREPFSWKSPVSKEVSFIKSDLTGLAGKSRQETCPRELLRIQDSHL